MSITVIQGHRC